MGKNSWLRKAKKVLASIAVIAMTVSMLPLKKVSAEETRTEYPYTLVAVSNEEGAITVNAENLCVNGSVATNGTVVADGEVTVNGEVLEQEALSMILLGDALNSTYFTDDGKEKHSSDYSFENTNITIDVPLEVEGDLTLLGNIVLNKAVSVKNDIALSGNAFNAEQAVLYAENGDITMDFNNINFIGLIYAPKGEVVISAPYANLNSVIIIAEKIKIETLYANVNYNESMASFIADTLNSSEDDEIEETVPEDLEFYAYGSYSEETNCIEIEWYTENEAESFSVWSSDDNLLYQEEATVAEALSYSYPITEEFDIKYFKVSMVDSEGKAQETLPFMITKSEAGYDAELFDADGDRIPDLFEAMLGTDAQKNDTDGDELTDYEELYVTGTDPIVFDSVTQGVSDAMADSDKDGLTNREEILLGTNPLLEDTDDDLLSDSDEVHRYDTNPLVVDSDEDRIKDGEEILLGLDPKNPMTYGVPDAEYRVEQSIDVESEVLEKVNTEENPYQMSIDIVAAGYAERNIAVEESKYSSVLQNDAILGFVPELSYGLEGITDATLRFEIDEEYTDNILGLFPEDEELTGIKRLNVFKYFEDLNMLLPIETKFDEDNNVLYAEVDELGTYCVMDMELWLESLGVIEQEETEPMVYAMRPTNTYEDVLFEGDMRLNVPECEVLGDGIEIGEETISDEVPMLMNARSVIKKETPVDVVFLLQSAGVSEYDFLLQKEMIENVMGRIYNEYEDVRVCVIGYKENEASVAWSHTYPIWQLEEYYLGVALSKIEYTLTDEYCNRGAAFSMMNVLDFRESAAKFVFHLANGNSGVQAGFFSELDVCAQKKINYTEILPLGSYYLDENFAAALQAAIDKTNGLSLTYTEETPDIVYEHIISHIAPPKYEFEVIVPNGWKKIKLDDFLTMDGLTDTDDDKLLDREEVNTELVYWDADGTIILPTLQECMELSKKPYAESGIDRFIKDNHFDKIPTAAFLQCWENAKQKQILPINSNPLEPDSDFDGYSDYDEILTYESNPLKSDIKIVEIQNEYIKINTSTETDENEAMDNKMYGGNQNWFYDTADSSENDLMSLRIQENGCGIIASCDLLLYIQKAFNIKLTEINATDWISYDQYEEFVRFYVNNYVEPFDLEEALLKDLKLERPYLMTRFEKLMYDELDEFLRQIVVDTSNAITVGTGSIGCFPTSVSEAFNQYCNDHKCYDMYMRFYQTKNYTQDFVEKKIEDSLYKDMPPVLLVGLYTDVPFKYENDLDMCRSMSTHYVVVTGIKYDYINNSTTLIVSTWSKKAELSLEGYMDSPGLLGGLYINSMY